MKTLSPFPAPTNWGNRLVLRSAVWDDYEGVPVAMAAWRDPPPETREKLTEALRLIVRFAPVQFERLREISRGIILARLHTADAAWRPDLNACLLDMDYLSSDRASAPAIAAVIIHELTHARLLRLGVANSTERRARTERVCHKAEQRVLTLFPDSPERALALIAIEERMAFDANFWSDDSMQAREEFYPWYIRLPRFFFRLLRRVYDRDREAPT